MSDNIDEKLEGPEIIKEEVRKALSQARTKKAVGPDKVNVELLKLINIDSNDILLKLFSNIYTTGNIFADWLRFTFISLSKKSNAKQCSDYKLISLISHALKVFLRILHSIMKEENRKEYSWDSVWI